MCVYVNMCFLTLSLLLLHSVTCLVHVPSPDQLLGAVFQEFLARKEDYLRALRGFLREIVRQVRNEFNFYSFAWSLMQKRDQPDLQHVESQHKVLEYRAGDGV